MNIKQLEAFVRIVKNKSFSQTAKELYLTQPTVSSYISSLEEDLGVQLFTRTTKEVHTTSEGEQIYLYAKDIVNLSNKIRNAFKEEQKDDINEIVISSSSIPGQYLLPGMLANFSKRYPSTEFRVHETDSKGAVSDVAEHRADIGFCGTIVPKMACTFLPFYEDELILITPNTSYYQKKKDSKDLVSCTGGFCDARTRVRYQTGSVKDFTAKRPEFGQYEGGSPLCEYRCGTSFRERGCRGCYCFQACRTFGD